LIIKLIKFIRNVDRGTTIFPTIFLINLTQFKTFAIDKPIVMSLRTKYLARIASSEILVRRVPPEECRKRIILRATPGCIGTVDGREPTF